MKIGSVKPESNFPLILATKFTKFKKFTKEFFEFSELKVSGVDKQITDKYLNRFNSEKKDLFNKVIMRNTVKDFFKTISSD